MADRRFKDRNWTLGNDDGNIGSWEHAKLALFMDLRDELKRLNQLLHCHRFVDVPLKLDRILRKMPAQKKRVRKS